MLKKHNEIDGEYGFKEESKNFNSAKRGRTENYRGKREKSDRGGSNNSSKNSHCESLFIDRYECFADRKTNQIDTSNSFEKFVADSGATEHLTNFKLIFKNIDVSEECNIKCANNNPNANLKSQGNGTVKIKLNNNETYELNNVIWAKNLTVSLLSLRKLVEQGLEECLNNKVIDILNPIT